MIVVGLLVVVAVVIVAVAVLETGGDPVRVHLHWFTISSDGGRLYVAGAVSVAVLVIGLWVLRHGLRRARGRRREIRELRERADAQPKVPRSPTAGASRATTAQIATRTPAPPPARRQPDADDHFDSTPRD